ncbi:MAG: hypothetical protein HY914_14475 [Desulfomonile tiedjei]|nr:hypothetical protein [Desulfomonile tiedjei]
MTAVNHNKETITRVKDAIHFDDLFRELYPDRYRPESNSYCPFHDDANASFAVYQDHGFCHAGCTPGTNGARNFDIFSLYQRSKDVDFAQALRELSERAGLSTNGKQNLGELLDTYDYHDEDGNVVYKSRKYRTTNKDGDPDKTFRQYRVTPDGKEVANMDHVRLVLYKLPLVIQADEVWIVEGEKDANNLTRMGLCGTTAPMGGDKAGGKWPKFCKDHGIHEPLRGKTVFVIPDNDDTGRKHAHAIALSLQGFAASVRLIELPGLPEKGDVSDFIEQHGLDEAKRMLLELAKDTPEYQPAEQAPETDPALTDCGNSQRMAKLYGDRIRYCKSLGWLVYDGKRWVPDECSEVMGMARGTVKHMYLEAAEHSGQEFERLSKHAIASQRAGRIRSMIELLPSEPGISVKVDGFDTHKWRLNCENGTIDLRNGNLYPHSDNDLITQLAPVEYDPEADCLGWKKFLHEAMNSDDEMVAFLQRLLGYSLTGQTSEQVWAFFWGKGANGKSTLLRTLAHVLGDYAVNTPAETFMETGGGSIRNDLARLRGARLVVASEPQSRKFDAGVIKTFTGEDAITARFLHREFFEFRPEGKLIFCANERPAVRDTSEGFWRRVILIPFERQFRGSDCDPHLYEALIEESPGILNWLMEGCKAWQHGGLEPPVKVSLAVQDYRDATDLLNEFLEECCEIEAALSVPKRELYDGYLAYCENSHIRKPLTQQKFNEDLRGRSEIVEKKLGPRDARVKSWVGINLRDDGNPMIKSCRRCDNELTCDRKQRNASTCAFYKE